MPSLTEQLHARRLSQAAEVQATYDAMIGELVRSSLIDRVLAIGDRFCSASIWMMRSVDQDGDATSLGWDDCRG